VVGVAFSHKQSEKSSSALPMCRLVVALVCWVLSARWLCAGVDVSPQEAVHPPGPALRSRSVASEVWGACIMLLLLLLLLSMFCKPALECVVSSVAPLKCVRERESVRFSAAFLCVVSG